MVGVVPDSVPNRIIDPYCLLYRFVASSYGLLGIGRDAGMIAVDDFGGGKKLGICVSHDISAAIGGHELVPGERKPLRTAFLGRFFSLDT